MSQSQIANRQSQLSGGFTLVELMISIALVLLLLVGINQVFKMTGDATGTGQALSAAVRDARAVQAVLNQDLGNFASDSPAIFIRSQVTPAFRSRQDALADRDGDPLTQDLDNDNIEGEAGVLGEQIPPALYSHRTHRTDILGFFARGVFPRQTGNDGVFAADMTAQEAWIWYGHLQLPTNGSPTGTLDPNRWFINNSTGGNIPTDPGAFDPASPSTAFRDNPNNLYSSQWPLGRAAVLLREATVPPGSPPGTLSTLTDNNNNPQWFYDAVNPPLLNSLQPLEPSTPPRLGGTNNYGSLTLQTSRYDLASTSVSAFKEKMRALPVAQQWWEQIMPVAQHRGSGTSARTYFRRYQCDPFLIDTSINGAPRAITSATAAREAPYMIGSCSHFFVEYAGDYLTQNATGGITAAVVNPAGTAYVPAGHDGEVDFVVTNPGTAQQRKQIRWYGMPRDTDGDGHVFNTPAATVLASPDVLPLRDVLRIAAGYNACPGAPFERFVPPTTPAGLPNPTLPTPAVNNDYAAVNSMNPDVYYTCAWGPGTTAGTPPAPNDLDFRPKLIRITVVIDDPLGRLGEGQRFEYVFKVP